MGVALYLENVRCGFPSPATDYLEDEIDLQKFLIPRPSSTFLIRAAGDSMKGAGILDNAILIVDRSLTAEHLDIVLAAVQGEFTVKRFVKKPDGAWLYPENNAYRPLRIDVLEDVLVWGIVTYFINQARKRAENSVI
ncbi:translesion error-prone DNA polymerase V autoproteolytic subunit [Paraflavisolibacter sp. H34]|uniref:translesion error-prone DNA polymerase V autoproteolytic subunit n=1 Tax=Huijunlia imazamoxiresistens TaxID=3127457 RepID=UPI00301AB699